MRGRCPDRRRGVRGPKAPAPARGPRPAHLCGVASPVGGRGGRPAPGAGVDEGEGEGVGAPARGASRWAEGPGAARRRRRRGRAVGPGAARVPRACGVKDRGFWAERLVRGPVSGRHRCRSPLRTSTLAGRSSRRVSSGHPRPPPSSCLSGSLAAPCAPASSPRRPGSAGRGTRPARLGPSAAAGHWSLSTLRPSARPLRACRRGPAAPPPRGDEKN